MTFSIYRPFGAGQSDFRSVKVTDIIHVTEYEYKRHRYEVGSFRIVVPADTYGIDKVTKDMLVFVLDDHVNDSLVITSVKNDGRNVTLSGHDLKYLLKWRVTLFPQAEIEAGTYGYDVATGSTGNIIRHYIEYNIAAPSDSDRRIYGMTFGSMSGGISEDTYMSRMQPVNEVVEALCKNADIGYSVDIIREGETTGYVVSITPELDRTNGQSVNSKAVFADYTLNTDSITIEESSSDRQNVIWAINGGTVDTATVTAVPNNEDGSITAASGFARHETVTTVNCETEEVELYARKDMKEKHDKTEINMESGVYDDYGTRYNVGDKVTVIKAGRAFDRRIQSVTKRCTGSSRTVQIVIDEIAEKKVIKRMNYATTRNAEETVTERLDGPEGGGSSSGVGENIGRHNERFNDYENNTISPNNYGDHNKISGYNNTIDEGNCFACDVGGAENNLNNSANVGGLVRGYNNDVGGTRNITSGDTNSNIGSDNITVGGRNAASGARGVTYGESCSNTREDALCGGDYGFTGNDFMLAIGHGGYASNPKNIFTVDKFGDVTAHAYNTSSADFAEYFEWADGNPHAEDRMGLLVEQIGDKIAPAQNDEFFGAISAHASVVGNAYEDYWHGKYVTDVYGRIQYDKDGRALISPDFDPSREYVPRSQRPEWAVMGLTGRIIVRDDGSCIPGGYVSARQGIAVLCKKWTPGRMLRRIDDRHIEILLK